MNKEDVKKGYLAAMATMEVDSQDAEQYWESYESSQYWGKNQPKLKNHSDLSNVSKRVAYCSKYEENGEGLCIRCRLDKRTHDEMVRDCEKYNAC